MINQLVNNLVNVGRYTLFHNCSNNFNIQTMQIILQSIVTDNYRNYRVSTRCATDLYISEFLHIRVDKCDKSEFISYQSLIIREIITDSVDFLTIQSALVEGSHYVQLSISVKSIIIFLTKFQNLSELCID